MIYGFWTFVIPFSLMAAGVLFLVFGIQSLLERERRAGHISLAAACVCTAGAGLFFFLPHLIQVWAAASAAVLAGISLIVLILPLRDEQLTDTPSARFDERDIPFSRMELQEGTEAFREYYNRRPELLKTDRSIRRLPGLLDPSSKEAHTLAYVSARASFDFCEDAERLVEGTPTDEKTEIDTVVLSDFIRSLARYYGALDAGITQLEDYHFYSFLGRKERRGAPGKLNHTHAVVFTVEMDHDHVAAAPAAPVVMESARQYAGAALTAIQLKNFIVRLGYDARAHIDGSYHVIAPLLARDAGLGEIGRMGLLMTPEKGPRVRLGVVTTNLPLQPTERRRDTSVIGFCRICKRCAENCPSRAIPFGERKQIDGAYRWRINMDSCFRYWNTAGTDCGRCMAVCPYSHPDKGLHKFIRRILRAFPRSRRPALWMENLFYGRSPRRGAFPDWIPPGTDLYRDNANYDDT